MVSWIAVADKSSWVRRSPGHREATSCSRQRRLAACAEHDDGRKQPRQEGEAARELVFHNAEGQCGDKITRPEGTKHRSEARGAAVAVLCVDGSHHGHQRLLKQARYGCDDDQGDQSPGDEPCHDDHDTVQQFVCGRHDRGAWVARRGYRAVLLLHHMHTAAPIRKIAPRTVGPRRTVPASGEKPVCAVTIPPAKKPRPDTAPTQPSQWG